MKNRKPRIRGHWRDWRRGNAIEGGARGMSASQMRPSDCVAARCRTHLRHLSSHIRGLRGGSVVRAVPAVDDPPRASVLPAGGFEPLERRRPARRPGVLASACRQRPSRARAPTHPRVRTASGSKAAARSVGGCPAQGTPGVSGARDVIGQTEVQTPHAKAQPHEERAEHDRVNAHDEDEALQARGGRNSSTTRRPATARRSSPAAIRVAAPCAGEWPRRPSECP